jgi:23S rRNA-/tRNA-specific pseudouridylate synthase
VAFLSEKEIRLLKYLNASHKKFKQKINLQSVQKNESSSDTQKGNSGNSKALAGVVTIFENDHFIVLNKPAGVLSIPTGYSQSLR